MRFTFKQTHHNKSFAHITFTEAYTVFENKEDPDKLNTCSMIIRIHIGFIHTMKSYSIWSLSYNKESEVYLAFMT